MTLESSHAAALALAALESALATGCAGVTPHHGFGRFVEGSFTLGALRPTVHVVVGSTPSGFVLQCITEGNIVLPSAADRDSLQFCALWNKSVFWPRAIYAPSDLSGDSAKLMQAQEGLFLHESTSSKTISNFVRRFVMASRDFWTAYAQDLAGKLR